MPYSRVRATGWRPAWRLSATAIAPRRQSILLSRLHYFNLYSNSVGDVPAMVCVYLLEGRRVVSVIDWPLSQAILDHQGRAMLAMIG